MRVLSTVPPNPEAPRRQHARYDLQMSAEVRTAQTAFTATTRDLSEAGAGLSAEKPLQEGEEVSLGLFLVLDGVESDTPPLWVKAHVVWAAEADDRRYAAGVRFDVITDDQRAWLRHVLQQLS